MTGLKLTAGAHQNTSSILVQQRYGRLQGSGVLKTDGGKEDTEKSKKDRARKGVRARSEVVQPVFSPRCGILVRRTGTYKQ